MMSTHEYRGKSGRSRASRLFGKFGKEVAMDASQLEAVGITPTTVCTCEHDASQHDRTGCHASVKRGVQRNSGRAWKHCPCIAFLPQTEEGKP